MSWIKKNKKKVAAVVVAAFALFATIADLTGTKKDDAVVDKLEPIVDQLDDWASEGVTNNVNTNQP